MKKHTGVSRFLVSVFLVFILLAAVASTFLACSSGTPTPTATSGQPIKLAAVIDESGVTAVIGLMSKVVFQMAVDDVNAAGGILGRPVQLLVYDDSGLPERAVGQVQQAINVDKVDAIVATSSDSGAIAQAPFANEIRLLQMYYGVMTPALTEDSTAYPYLLSDATNNSIINEYMADFLVNKVNGTGSKHIGILADNLAWGQSSAQGVAAAMKDLGVTPVDVLTFDPNELDLTTYLKTLQSKGADVVYFASFGAPVPRVEKNVNDMGWDVTIVGGPPFALADWTQVSDLQSVKNTVTFVWPGDAVAPGQEPGPAIQAFMTKLLAKVGGVDKFLAGAGDVAIEAGYYDEIWLVHDLMEAAGATDGPSVIKVAESGKVFKAHALADIVPSYSFGPNRHYAYGVEPLSIAKVWPMVDQLYRQKVQ